MDFSKKSVTESEKFFHKKSQKPIYTNKHKLIYLDPLKRSDTVASFCICYNVFMIKTTIIAIIVIVFAGLGLFLINNKSTNKLDTPVVQDSNQTMTENENNSQGKKMAFSEFLKQDKGSYQCTVNQYIDAGMSQSTQGEVFLYDGNIRGDFATQVSGMSILSSVIVRDGFSYTWTNMAPIGYKVSVIDTNNAQSQSGMSGTYSWNAEQIGDYDCQEWDVDKTQFEIPTQIQFQEI